MKTIDKYINERLHVTTKSFHACKPKTKDELREIIIQRIKEDGKKCDLNNIDVSDITDMSCLFNAGSWKFGNTIFKNFNGDISMWDVSNVTNMTEMFWECKKFNCDLSRWNMSNVENTNNMFWGCEKFNCDLSKWDMSHVTDMHCMFQFCKNFKQNLDEWNVSKDVNMFDAFRGCATKPKWYKE